MNVPFKLRDEALDAPFLKGAEAPRVTLRLYGGTYGNTRTRVIGGPCLNVGEEVVLFLRANGAATFDVTNLAEGKWSVIRVPGQPAGVERDLGGIQYVLGSGAPDAPQTLDALKAAVRAAATGEVSR